MRHYHALLSAAFEMQMPVTFRTDLTTHDRAQCEKHPDTRPFIWALGSTGTNLVWLDSVDPKILPRHKARSLIQCFLENDRAMLYYWDGTELARVDADTAISLIAGDMS